MDIRFQNLLYVIPAGFAAIAILDIVIWRVNGWWEKKHPTKPRHPFSPAFTAGGVVIVHACSAFVIPWQYVLVDFAGFVIFGGTMWILHQIRWKRRNQAPEILRDK